MYSVEMRRDKNGALWHPKTIENIAILSTWGYEGRLGERLTKGVISHAIESDAVEGTRARGDISHIKLGSQKPEFT